MEIPHGPHQSSLFEDTPEHDPVYRFGQPPSNYVDDRDGRDVLLALVFLVMAAIFLILVIRNWYGWGQELFYGSLAIGFTLAVARWNA